MNGIDPFKPISKQLDVVLPQLTKHNDLLDKVLPFILLLPQNYQVKLEKRFSNITCWL